MTSSFGFLKKTRLFQNIWPSEIESSNSTGSRSHTLNDLISAVRHGHIFEIPSSSTSHLGRSSKTSIPVPFPVQIPLEETDSSELLLLCPDQSA